MKRRDFTTRLGVAVSAWPLAAYAQKPAMPVVGFLHGNKLEGDAGAVAGIKQGLKECGFIEGENVAIDYRWADNYFDRLPALAAELVRRRPDVIIAGGGSAAAVAVKAVTSTIPMVLGFGSDPVELGLVKSLTDPARTVTGVIFHGQHIGERIDLLCRIAPRARRIAYLRPGPQYSNAVTEEQTENAAAAARKAGREILVLKVESNRDIDAAFATLVEQGADALDIAAHPFFDDDTTCNQLATLALRYKIPALFIQRAFPAAGGLMSYGESYAEGFRRVGVQTGRILKGEKPADLPFDQTTTVELIINNGTARALGLAIPEPLLARAAELLD